jgi:ATP-dependent protease ClpP protease subunit
LAQQIIKERQNKLQQGLDLQKWYTGEEAVKAGIADQIGGVHSVFGLKQNAFVLERG